MKNNYAPMKERGNCVAGAHDSTAIQKITQSRAQQSTRILKWLQVHKRITTLEARNILGIMHPASRIQELRNAGHDIVTYLQWDTDATGKKHKQGLYVLQGGDV